jgi:arginase
VRPQTSGGLTWAELTSITVSALQAGGCRGWDVVVYNPDLDPERDAAKRIVQFIGEVLNRLSA